MFKFNTPKGKIILANMKQHQADVRRFAEEEGHDVSHIDDALVFDLALKGAQDAISAIFAVSERAEGPAAVRDAIRGMALMMVSSAEEEILELLINNIPVDVNVLYGEAALADLDKDPCTCSACERARAAIKVGFGMGTMPDGRRYMMEPLGEFVTAETMQ
tara:strand:+ start:6314 stop:6796 length:483 start_codon:yes stop_codon:yes gene_type:complete